MGRSVLDTRARVPSVGVGPLPGRNRDTVYHEIARVPISRVCNAWRTAFTKSTSQVGTPPSACVLMLAGLGTRGPASRSATPVRGYPARPAGEPQEGAQHGDPQQGGVAMHPRRAGTCGKRPHHAGASECLPGLCLPRARCALGAGSVLGSYTGLGATGWLPSRDVPSGDGSHTVLTFSFGACSVSRH